MGLSIGVNEPDNVPSVNWTGRCGSVRHGDSSWSSGARMLAAAIMMHLHRRGASVGLFSRRETPVTEELVLRVEFAPEGKVIYSLEKGTPNRRWMLKYARHPKITGNQSMEEMVWILVQDGMDLIRKDIPSFEPGQLQVQLEDTFLGSSSPEGTGKELLAFGNVQYLKSEWERSLPKV
jgi:hypothetical protein